jgi:predicted nucleic acid-binding protein
LIRAGKHQALERLDALVQKLGYIPLVEQAMRVAAELWADARRSGRPTAPNYSLDADCLLAAQARTFLDLNRIHRWEKFTRKEKRAGISVQIATTNIGHLSRYAHVIEIPSP